MTEENKITIEIDGQALEAEAGELLIDVADRSGINIPRFCYHNRLSIAASCRMCLVEVEKVPKPIPACATQVMDGMKVQTRSPGALAAQKGTMEFLLINHPLDCPICDQGGECELQDVALGYGDDISRFVEGKRSVPSPDIGPLVATDMSRCIHCTRCVRFGDEIAGLRELGATHRGEYMTIGTHVQHSLASELSGNVIDLCPVGALTSKPFRYRARAWELTSRPSIAPHDSVGSNIDLHVRRGRVMRVHPRSNESINEIWISDRDRFSYEGLYADDRLTTPLIKKDGQWNAVDWQTALEFAVNGLSQVAGEEGDQLGTLVSPGSTLEECYLAQKIARGLGSPHIDHRLRQSDERADETAPSLPWLGQAVADLENLDAALLIGSNIRKDQPLLAHRLRKAVLKGAAVSFVNPLGFDLHFDAEQIVASPAGMVQELAAIANALGLKGSGPLSKVIDAAKADNRHQAIAGQLKEASGASVLLGDLAAAHPDYSILRALAAAIADGTGATLGFLPVAGAVGAALAGAVPHRGAAGRAAAKDGLGASAMLAAPRKGYLLLGIEPDLDTGNPQLARNALAEAGFVVALSAYRTPSLEMGADVLLPITPFTETCGTFVNAEGTWQGFCGAVSPLGDSRPGWKVLRVLGNLFDLDGFDYTSPEEVKAELQQACEGVDLDNTLSGEAAGEVRATTEGLVRIGDVPIYAGDALVRRAGSLQQTADGTASRTVRINATVAELNGLTDSDAVIVVQDGSRVTLPLTIDAGVPDGCVRVAAGIPGSESLGGQFGVVTLEKV